MCIHLFHAFPISTICISTASLTFGQYSTSTTLACLTLSFEFHYSNTLIFEEDFKSVYSSSCSTKFRIMRLSGQHRAATILYQFTTSFKKHHLSLHFGKSQVLARLSLKPKSLRVKDAYKKAYTSSYLDSYKFIKCYTSFRCWTSENRLSWKEDENIESELKVLWGIIYDNQCIGCDSSFFLDTCSSCM